MLRRDSGYKSPDDSFSRSRAPFSRLTAPPERSFSQASSSTSGFGSASDRFGNNNNRNNNNNSNNNNNPHSFSFRRPPTDSDKVGSPHHRSPPPPGRTVASMMSPGAVRQQIQSETHNSSSSSLSVVTPPAAAGRPAPVDPKVQNPMCLQRSLRAVSAMCRVAKARAKKSNQEAIQAQNRSTEEEREGRILRRDNEDLRRQLEQLQRENERLKAASSTASALTNEELVELQEARNNVAGWTVEINLQREKVDYMTNQISDWRLVFNDIAGQLRNRDPNDSRASSSASMKNPDELEPRDLAIWLEELMRKHAEQVGQLQVQRKNKEDEITRLKAELAKRQTAVDDAVKLVQKMQEYQTANVSLNERVSQLTDDVQEKQTKIHTLKNTLEQLRFTNTCAITEKENEMKKITRSIEASAQRQLVWEKYIQRQAILTSGVQRVVESQKEKLEQVKQENMRIIGDFERSQVDLKSATDEIAQVVKQRDEFKERWRKLQNEVASDSGEQNLDAIVNHLGQRLVDFDRLTRQTHQILSHSQVPRKQASPSVSSSSTASVSGMDSGVDGIAHGHDGTEVNVPTTVIDAGLKQSHTTIQASQPMEAPGDLSIVRVKKRPRIGGSPTTSCTNVSTSSSLASPTSSAVFQDIKGTIRDIKSE